MDPVVPAFGTATDARWPVSIWTDRLRIRLLQACPVSAGLSSCPSCPLISGDFYQASKLGLGLLDGSWAIVALLAPLAGVSNAMPGLSGGSAALVSVMIDLTRLDSAQSPS